MANRQHPAKTKSKRKGSRYDRAVRAGILIAVAAIALTLWGPLGRFVLREENKPLPAKKQAAADLPQEKRNRGEMRKKRGDRAAHTTEKAALVAIVIDDLGQDLKPVRELLAIPAAVTLAVMPGLPYSRDIARLARRNNRELLLHLPMEHRNGKGKKQAPGMLRSDMTPLDFLATINDDLASVPGAIGVNNHEGSLLTESPEAMKFLMAELRARNLIFLDSLTTPRSVAHATAREFGLKAARRDVFLDNDSDNREAIRARLDELGRIARERGRAVGIGHPHPATIGALRNWLASAGELGIEIVPVSRIAQL